MPSACILRSESSVGNEQCSIRKNATAAPTPDICRTRDPIPALTRVDRPGEGRALPGPAMWGDFWRRCPQRVSDWRAPGGWGEPMDERLGLFQQEAGRRAGGITDD